MKSFRVQVTYKGGRKETIDSFPDRYNNVDEMIDEMTSMQWYRHPKGAVNMLEVESVNPVGGYAGDPRRVS